MLKENYIKVKRTWLYILIAIIISNYADLITPIFYPEYEANMFFHYNPLFFYWIKIIIFPLTSIIMYKYYINLKRIKFVFLCIFVFFLYLNLLTLIGILSLK